MKNLEKGSTLYGLLFNHRLQYHAVLSDGVVGKKLLSPAQSEVARAELRNSDSKTYTAVCCRGRQSPHAQYLSQKTEHNH